MHIHKHTETVSIDFIDSSLTHIVIRGIHGETNTDTHMYIYICIRRNTDTHMYAPVTIIVVDHLLKLAGKVQPSNLYLSS